ncbi:TetR/AcrR family transcriptional regulator [Sphaerisporangium fuscum]|uniref:TetR/AcrR family transcriptional regulator n=1 Tax=Sphaerisporangium fuscum TaxID=2835868 RepID=UPI001BDC1815|nr:TetR/AcrR family transcriptional regulator [Sphaerisporangium fuscum]
MRADARRNRQRILDVAGEAFTVDGTGVSLDEIARRAGVGAGTVHRHFPTKEALLDAVVADHLKRLHDTAAEALTAQEPGAALFGFLRHMIETAGPKQELTQVLTESGATTSEETAQAAAGLRAAFDALLCRAQQAGAVRGDLDAVAVQAVVAGAVAAVRHSARPDVGAVILECLRP